MDKKLKLCHKVIIMSVKIMRQKVKSMRCVKIEIKSSTFEKERNRHDI